MKRMSGSDKGGGGDKGKIDKEEQLRVIGEGGEGLEGRTKGQTRNSERGEERKAPS